MTERISRRRALASLAATAGTVAIGSPARALALPARAATGRIKQSVCQWCYPSLSVDALCREAAAIGLRSVELLGEKDWDTVRRHGLTCAMANGPTQIALGLNRPDHHDRFVRESERLLPLIAERGFPNMIVFSGNRGGMSDGEGLGHCVTALRRIVPTAERLGVTVCMELLNSKVDHADYMCDRTPWGVELVHRVGSPRFKLLYDIYHMQIMEGDVIRTIRDNFAHIGHYHTGGVPGRRELDERQELFYPAIMTALADLGYAGFVGQEFVPSPGRDPMASLRHGVRVCTV